MNKTGFIAAGAESAGLTMDGVQKAVNAIIEEVKRIRVRFSA